MRKIKLSRSMAGLKTQRSQEDFIDMCLEISKIYDGLVASTKKPPTDSEFIPIDAANAIINDLREYVKEFLDVKFSINKFC